MSDCESIPFEDHKDLLSAAEDRIAELEAERDALRAEVAKLQLEKAKLIGLCKDTINEVVDWAGYAPVYFQYKHGLAETLRNLRSRLSDFHRESKADE